jgi:hypothetical protein
LGKKRKRRAEDGNISIENPYPFIGEKERFLIGWPGYRTRQEKFGLIYMDTQAEWGHMQGVMLRLLWEKKFKTHNPIYLAGMAFWGLLLSMGLVVILLGMIKGIFIDFASLVFLALCGFTGILLLVNFFASLDDLSDSESITGD